MLATLADIGMVRQEAPVAVVHTALGGRGRALLAPALGVWPESVPAPLTPIRGQAGGGVDHAAGQGWWWRGEG